MATQLRGTDVVIVGLGAAGGVAVILDEAGDFVSAQGARLFERHLRPVFVAIAHEGFALGRPGAGGDGLAAIGLKHRMADRADMP